MNTRVIKAIPAQGGEPVSPNRDAIDRGCDKSKDAQRYKMSKIDITCKA